MVEGPQGRPKVLRPRIPTILLDIPTPLCYIYSCPKRAQRSLTTEGVRLPKLR